MMPKLFGTISCRIGEPVYIDSKLSGDKFEQKRIEIEKIMQNQMYEMDEEFNLPRIQSDLNSSEYRKQRRTKTRH